LLPKTLLVTEKNKAGGEKGATGEGHLGILTEQGGWVGLGGKRRSGRVWLVSKRPDRRHDQDEGDESKRGAQRKGKKRRGRAQEKAQGVDVKT